MSQDSIIPDGPDIELELAPTKENVAPACQFITGIAGSGKSFYVRSLAEADPKWGLLCATTGIAAVNMGTITLNSALGFFDTSSLEDLYACGRLQMKLAQVARVYRHLAIDEVSMMDGRQLDILYRAVTEANGRSDVSEPLGIVLTGDMMQLPPIKAQWVFEAESWPEFDRNTLRLTTNYRQGDGEFLDALNHLRSGNGPAAVDILRRICTFTTRTEANFDGTVIVGKNVDVDRYNWIRYSKVPGVERTYPSTRWGRESGGWRLIPDELKLKVGSYVMILANDTSRDLSGNPRFSWVNGDCGEIVDLGPFSVVVKLRRTGEEVDICRIERRTEQKHSPDEFSDTELEDAKEYGSKLSDGTFWDTKKSRWVRGSITYLPLRLAWATTVHKSQGVTLDRVLVDLRNAFLGEPSMVYVATSRCRTAAGLHLIGTPDMLVRRTKTDPKVARWL